MTNVNPPPSHESGAPASGRSVIPPVGAASGAPASGASSSSGTVPSQPEEVRLRVEGFKSLVEDVIEGRFPSDKFLEKLQELGATPGEGRDYLHLLEQRLDQQRRGPAQDEPADDESPTTDQREKTPEGLTESETEEYRARRAEAEAAAQARIEASRKKATESAAWAVLRAKLKQIVPNSREPASSGLSAEDLAELFNIKPSPSESLSLPSHVLALAPHLRELCCANVDDPHVKTTWELRRALASEKTIDNLVDILQVQPLLDPIPRSIWKLIAQDLFVDFEKLHASMDRGYDHNDDPREFAGGFALIKKDSSSARKPLKTESEWSRVFSAWSAGVRMVYRHRSDELAAYQQYITNMFRAVPDPKSAINFDLEVRDRYSKSPFRLDVESNYHFSLLSQLFRASTSSSSLGKRAQSGLSSGQQSKVRTVPCQNWNFGKCSDPCPNRRLHGICSECGLKHRARDNSTCDILLQAKRDAFNKGKSGASGGAGESSSGSAGRA
jgi:hypothetical protein